MANIKSKIKSHKQSEKSNLRNKSYKSKIKTATKKVYEEPTQENINYVVKLLDSAVTKGVFHKNKSSRLKSRIMKVPIVATTSK